MIQTGLSSILGPAASLGGLAWLFIGPASSLCHNKLIRFLLVVNVLTVRECLHHWLDCMVVTAFISIATYGKIRDLYLLIGSLIIAIVNPALGPCLCIVLHQNLKHNKTLASVILTALALALQLGAYSEFYFAKLHEPHSGIAWILFPHIFERYQLMYQLLTLLAPYLLLPPLLKCRCSPWAKICIAWFASIYFIPDLSPVNLLALYWLEASLYFSVMESATVRNRTVWKVLTLLGLVVSTCTYCFYERLLHLWTTSHLVTMGYLLLQILLFWGTHSVYLAESLTILDPPQKQAKSQKILLRIGNYFKGRLSQF